MRHQATSSIRARSSAKRALGRRVMGRTLGPATVKHLPSDGFGDPLAATIAEVLGCDDPRRALSVFRARPPQVQLFVDSPALRGPTRAASTLMRLQRSRVRRPRGTTAFPRSQSPQTKGERTSLCRRCSSKFGVQSVCSVNSCSCERPRRHSSSAGATKAGRRKGRDQRRKGCGGRLPGSSEMDIRHQGLEERHLRRYQGLCCRRFAVEAATATEWR